MYYNRSLYGSSGGCSHACHTDHTLTFGYGKLAAAFEYQPVEPWAVETRRLMPQSPKYLEEAAEATLARVMGSVGDLFEAFRTALSELCAATKDPSLEGVTATAAVTREVTEIEAEMTATGLALLESLGGLGRAAGQGQGGREAVARLAGLLGQPQGQVQGQQGETSAAPSVLSSDTQLKRLMKAQRDVSLLSFQWNERLEATGGLLRAIQSIATRRAGAHSWLQGPEEGLSLRQAVQRLQEVKTAGKVQLREEGGEGDLQELIGVEVEAGKVQQAVAETIDWIITRLEATEEVGAALEDILETVTTPQLVPPLSLSEDEINMREYYETAFGLNVDSPPTAAATLPDWDQYKRLEV
ncbi:unnamed protein product, partial [Chrysoparadoxa australica]